MATTALGGNPINTVGDLPAVGAPAPSFELVGADFSAITLPEGQRAVLNIFPSIDTAVCATSVRKFNELASGLENTTVICVSQDLPMAQARFCGAEGIENVKTGSTFRSSFGEDYGVKMTDGGPARPVGGRGRRRRHRAAQRARPRDRHRAGLRRSRQGTELTLG
jgi:thioredoxin-dependent peroxiredoxin